MSVFWVKEGYPTPVLGGKDADRHFLILAHANERLERG